MINASGWDELLAPDSDCLSYFGDSIGRELESAQTVRRFLERGTGAVTIAVLSWACPRRVVPEFREPVDAATPSSEAGVPSRAASERLEHSSVPIPRNVCVRPTPAGHDPAAAGLGARVE